MRMHQRGSHRRAAPHVPVADVSGTRRRICSPAEKRGWSLTALPWEHLDAPRDAVTVANEVEGGAHVTAGQDSLHRNALTGALARVFLSTLNT